MSNSKSILKNTKKQVAQLAKDIAKEGTAEVLNQPKAQMGKDSQSKSDQPSVIVEAMQQKGSSAKVTKKGIKNVADIEEEIAKLRKKRKEEEEKARQPEEAETPPKLSEPGKPILPSSPKRGAKVSRPEQQKTKIESRLGKN